jgi:hypothetical protein
MDGFFPASTLIFLKMKIVQTNYENNFMKITEVTLNYFV